MSPSPSAMSVGHPAGTASEPSRKRRKRNVEKESIYLVPDIKPYALSIKQRTNGDARPSWTTGPASEPGADYEDVIEDQTGARSERSRSRRSSRAPKQIKGDATREDEKEAYRARALKAWETKRQRQRERFEALESGVISHPSRSRATSRQDGEGTSPTALDPSLGLDLLDLPDNLPKDDLLNSLHAYTAKYYSQRGLLLPDPARTGTSLRYTRNQSRRSTSTTSTPAPASPISRESTTTPEPIDARAEGESSPDPMTMPLGHIPGLDDSGSEYEHSEEEVDQADSSDDDGPEEPRKRGGQPGKRKVRDMYLALDGSALLALGVLVQEQVIAHLREQGYVSASALAAARDLTRLSGQFEVSDDETEDSDIGEEMESEEGL